MRVVVTVENRFDITPDGAVWTQMAFPNAFWQRYLDVFDKVRIVSRGRPVLSVPGTYLRVDGPGVEFWAVPHYHGPQQFIKVAMKVIRSVRASANAEDAVIMRTGGSLLAACLEPVLQKQAKPYGVEVVGDASEVFAPGAIKHPLRPLFRWWFTQAQKRQCSRAAGAAYVTEFALQKSYPCTLQERSISDVDIDAVLANPYMRGYSTHYSSLGLVEAQFVPDRRSDWKGQSTKHLVLVGSLEHLHKGPDILIRAVARCMSDFKLNLELTIIGDGRHKQELESLAAYLGIASQVHFLGLLPPGEAVTRQLDLADIFVLPSRTEGLPRAMIEAMARGLPCIGTQVGGIPELLPAEDMVPPNDVMALTRKIVEIVIDNTRLTAMSARNLDKAKGYGREVLRGRRIEFYTYIRSVTDKWLKKSCARM